MKNLLFIFICLTFSVFNIFAQESPSIYKTQIDSVQTFLNKTSKSDTLRVIELNRLARLCIYDLQYEKGLSAASEARALAKKIGYHLGEGMYLRTLDILHYDDRREEPYNILTFWIFADLKKTEYPIKIQISSKVDQVKRTKELEIASNALDEKGNMEMAAHAYHLLAYDYLKIKNSEKALESIEKAEGIFASIKLDIPLIESKILKIKILKQAGRDLDARNVELQVVKINEQHEDEREKSLLYSLFGSYYFWNTQQTDISLDYALKSIQILENLGEKHFLAKVYYYAGATYYYLDFPQKTVEYLAKSFDLIKSGKISDNWIYGFYNFYPSKLVAVGNYEKAEEIVAIGKSLNTEEEYLLNNQGVILMGKGQYNEALEMFYRYYELDGLKRGEPGGKSWMNYYMASCLSRLGKLNESNRYALKSYQQGIQVENGNSDIKKACFLLYENYEKLGQTDKALEYLKIYTEWVKKDKLQDILNRTAQLEIQAVINKSTQEKMILEQEKILQEKANQTQRWWLFTIAAGLFSSLLVLYLLFKNNRNKQKANKLLEQQKEEINTQKNKAEEALNILKSTQSQLIQSEKMASLGELTAGIAHEIQNPLNFVNNFSEVNSELVEELKSERLKKKGERDKTMEEELLNYIAQNTEKIKYHGKRASDIVKGMLQHSRTSNGVKEPTDINALADEYLRLSYHGLRAKDKSFNADFKTEFDESLPKINVIPQDIGRVLLNLINNAFYAVDKKAKDLTPLIPPSADGGTENPQNQYKPIVTVTTSHSLSLGEGRGEVKISVKDNGSGIPPSIVDKIFQPFFTTKPTGQGTGLGLSLSYDIINAHGGRLYVKSVENNGTEFIIEIPVKT